MRLLILFILSPLFLFSQTQIGNDIDGIIAGDNAGHAVSLSANGSVVAVGSPSNDGNEIGEVRVFENISNDWIQIGETINGENLDDHFGTSVSLSSDGSTIVIGSPDTEISGYVSVYENISGTWTQVGENINGDPEFIDGDGWQANFSFGRSVSISDDGTIIAIAEDKGSFWEAGYGNNGYMHIYINNSGVWMLLGDAIHTGISYLNDISLSGDGKVVAISGAGDCPWPCWFGNIGLVEVYKNISGVWMQVGSTFSGANGWEGEHEYISGVSLNTHGSKLAIGGKYNRVYENIEDVWVQVGDDIESEYNYNHSISLSNDGTILSFSTRFINPSQFVTRIYTNSSGTWTQLGTDILDEVLESQVTNYLIGLGMQVSGDGTTLVIGAPFNDNIGIDAGHARVYDLSALLSIEESTLSAVKLYPNPTTNQFTIQLPDSQTLEKVNIYNSLGQFIQTRNIQVIKTSHLASGLYYVEVITNTGNATKKLIIE